MLHNDTVTLFVPYDRNGFDIMWRKYVLKNVTIETFSSEDGGGAVMYAFYDRVKFFFSGKRIPAFKIRRGSIVIGGVYGQSDEEIVTTLPTAGAFRVVKVEHRIRGNMRVHHTKLTMK